MQMVYGGIYLLQGRVKKMASKILTASLIIPRYLRLMIFAKKILTRENLGYFFFCPIITKPS
jgi:hypothetical protein